MVTPAARREAVAHLRIAFEVSERRACSTLGADRTSVRYCSRRPSDAVARARLRELASVRRRFGYRRLQILLTREGIVMKAARARGRNPPGASRHGASRDLQPSDPCTLIDQAPCRLV